MQKKSKDREKYMEFKKAKYQGNIIKMKARIAYLGPKSNRNSRWEHKKRNTVLQIHVLKEF